MGAPAQGTEAADQPAAETLLDAFKTISAAERRKHASVLNYWLSIRGDKEFPPLHDLDPLELSDAGPNSILLELISGGHDAEVRHLGEALRFEGKVERIIDAAGPSILACVAKKLPIVAISRDFLAFEDEYEGADGKIHCWATLLPLSAGGAWVDYVYALVTFDGEGAKAVKPKAGEAKKAKAKEPEPEEAEEPVAEEVHQPAAEEVAEPIVEEVEEPEPDEVEEPVAEAPVDTEEVEPPVEAVEDEQPVEAVEEEPIHEPTGKTKPGFSKLFDNLVGLTGFYGHGYKVEPGSPAAEDAADKSAEEISAVEESPVEQPAVEEPAVEDAEEALDEQPSAEQIEEPVDEPAEAEESGASVDESAEPAEDPTPVAPEGSLKSKLTDVRSRADEARMAKLKANVALYDGLSAAYDFALDAEDAPEEYLRLVEAEGLKIQLRSPMRPVVKLAFNGMCDEGTIRQLETVLAWALDNELPRGSLAEQIEAAGGIGPILSGEAKAA